MRAKPEPKKSIPISVVVAIVMVVAIGALGVWRWSARAKDGETKPAATATYVGQQRCADCHAEETKAWRTSHHAQAMQVTNDSTVLGDFNDAHFTKDGVTSSFFKKDNKFYVRTEGAEGKPQDFELPYTFGVAPLQQYLVPFANGRLQSFVVAWDSRNKADGGQRWFHLYPDQRITARRSAALDRTQPDVELHVRQLPLDESAGLTTIWRRTATIPSGLRSMSRASPVTGRDRTTWPGRRTTREDRTRLQTDRTASR